MHRLLLAAAILGALLIGEAEAHVTANPNEAPAGAYFRTVLRISHGCNGSPTVAIRVKIPDGLTAVKPQAKPGWDITIKMRKLEKPVDAGHGRMVSEAVDEIAWRGGPLPDAYFDEFGLSMKLPDKPHTTLWFPTVQECQQGVHRWIEIPTGQQKWDELKEPAPFIKLIGFKPGK